MKVETTITFETTFDEEMNAAYDKNSFEKNLELLRQVDEETKQQVEDDFCGENVVVTSVFVQD
jgi:hypothetical protein